MKPSHFLACLCWIVLASVGCANTPQQPDPPSVPLKNAQTFLKLSTYDGSGQVTEPSVVTLDSPWHGFKYWMAFSPYPNGDESKENPSIAASNDGITWEVPRGLTNPLEIPTSGYFADASLFYDSQSDQLWVYYIQVSGARDSLKVLRRVSSDGVHWLNKSELFQLPTYEALSPTVAKVDSTYTMWTVNSGGSGCSAATSTIESRTSSDGIKWSGSYSTNIALQGYVMWHLTVTYVAPKQEYWAAIAAYPDGLDCSDTFLFFANSQDGVVWTTYSKPVLTPGSSWDNEEIYKSTVLFDGNTSRLRVWYSAVSSVGAWHVGLTEGDFDRFLEWLQQ